MTRAFVGLFVGGRGSRLGGAAKGNLVSGSGERLIARLIDVCAQAFDAPELVLVGASEAYADLGLASLRDSPAGIGPLGGLRALLIEAEARGRQHAYALACDLPYLDAPLLRRLSTEALDAALLAPREGELWQPLVARYETVAALAAVDAALSAGDRALQRVAARLGDRARPLSMDASERLAVRDCDSPEELAAAGLHLPR